jgi:Gas vesicle synthesis protein GvpL/GvpF
MSLLLYAIADGPVDAPGGVEGVAASAVRAVGADGLVALVSEHERAPAVDEAALWAFDEVIESHMGDRAVLPARFGSMVQDVAALQALLDGRRVELSAKLERVRGAVELGVRAGWRDLPGGSAPDPEPTGTAYMLDRVARNRRARDLAKRIDRVLAPLARATHCQVLARPAVPVSAAYLVDRGRVGEFAAAVVELDAATEDAELVCTGPWPPYSFTEERGDG